ncbi:uncharacterized protein [Littorina saxatilis]|uniref:Uncharacterized protein n=1 Tax=Littorina saxatilis TaxID=31220 RepID=A0AAN9BIE1_9CAEN
MDASSVVHFPCLLLLIVLTHAATVASATGDTDLSLQPTNQEPPQPGTTSNHYSKVQNENQPDQDFSSASATETRSASSYVSMNLTKDWVTHVDTASSVSSTESANDHQAFKTSFPEKATEKSVATVSTLEITPKRPVLMTTSTEPAPDEVTTAETMHKSPSYGPAEDSPGASTPGIAQTLSPSNEFTADSKNNFSAQPSTADESTVPAVSSVYSSKTDDNAGVSVADSSPDSNALTGIPSGVSVSGVNVGMGDASSGKSERGDYLTMVPFGVSVLSVNVVLVVVVVAVIACVIAMQRKEANRRRSLELKCLGRLGGSMKGQSLRRESSSHIYYDIDDVPRRGQSNRTRRTSFSSFIAARPLVPLPTLEDRNEVISGDYSLPSDLPTLGNIQPPAFPKDLSRQSSASNQSNGQVNPACEEDGGYLVPSLTAGKVDFENSTAKDLPLKHDGGQAAEHASSLNRERGFPKSTEKDESGYSTSKTLIENYDGGQSTENGSSVAQEDGFTAPAKFPVEDEFGYTTPKALADKRRGGQLKSTASPSRGDYGSPTQKIVAEDCEPEYSTPEEVFAKGKSVHSTPTASFEDENSVSTASPIKKGENSTHRDSGDNSTPKGSVEDSEDPYLTPIASPLERTSRF